MSSIRLSFCMPTYNYGRFIATAIRSVFAQTNGRSIEVVVLDGASTDDTTAVIAALGPLPNVRYVRRQERGGIDADLAASVDLASGDYCWLLSADDALREGALERMLREIDQGYDLVLCNRIWCAADLRPIRSESWLDGESADRVVDLSDRRECLAYFARARSLGALFSFMSSIVFRRAAWMSVAAEPALDGSHYAHVARLLGVGLAGGRFKYVADPLVLCRGGADSFRAGGLASRLMIDLRGYKAVAATVFPADVGLQEGVKRVVRNEHPWHRWLKARSETSDVDQWRSVEVLMREFGYSPYGVRLVDRLGRMLGSLRRLVPALEPRG
jgi:abequosyltransferase